ncbi:coiled-coil domain-containing protein 180 isoform X1 [Pelobates fuscus]|uniref:coiled-coil domain-containing protein 180 isoform X1 n=1 Tax=Pelobates fuscus TaxID=191477 RepID=UPI002FE46B4F
MSTMALVGEIHVVPSGKVYRQIFDAEVQLVRSLGETRSRVLQHGTFLDSGKLSASREGRTQTAGLLSERQRTWVDCMPYDCSTENPVLIREKESSSIKEAQLSEDAIAAGEVRGLCDVVVAEKTESGIIQRIVAKRQERHNSAVSNLHVELADISKKTEALVLEAGRLIQEQVLKSDKKVDLFFQQIEEDQKYTTYTLKSLNETWQQVADESSLRRSWIKNLENTLLDLEEKRADCIAEVLRQFTRSLTEICYLMPSDAYRMIHKEAMMINQAILANRRAIAKLCTNLKEADLKREGAQRLRWQDLVNSWKHFQKQSTINAFREFVKNQMCQTPSMFKKELDLFVVLQESINEKRMQHLCTVGNFVPPKCTKTEVTEWLASFDDLNNEILSLNTQFVDRLHSLLKDVSQKCFTESEKYKEHLVTLNICSKDEANNIVTDELCSLTENIQVKYNKEREMWNEALKTAYKETDFQIEKLFTFSKEAVHLWDMLEIGLKKQENLMQKTMDSCRQRFDMENQAREADLIIILENLRKENTAELLKSTMRKALASLKTIKAGYKTFHIDQVNIVESYPAVVLKELMEYSSTVSKYFGVKEVYGQEVYSDGNKKQTSPVDPSQAAVTSPPGEMSTLSCEDTTAANISVEGVLSDGHQVKILDSSIKHEVQHSQEFTAGTSEQLDTGQVTKEAGELQQEDTAELMSPSKVVEQEESSKDASLVEESSTDQETLGSFTTSKGNTYTILRSAVANDQENNVSFTEQSEIQGVFMTEATTDESSLQMDAMIIPKDVFTKAMDQIRFGFYEHLENWFDESVAYSYSLVMAKKEELGSELKLRIHHHAPRSKRIEMDIHNVRAAELHIHAERVDRHCEGVKKSLNQLKDESFLLIENMKRETLNFRSKICDMESIFLNANKSDKLVTLSNSLSSILDNHLSGVQTTMRQYRQHLEEMLGKLRDTNSDFINSLKLFSDGGNFSPEEVETYRKKLHKSSKIIASFEESIMVDLDSLESVCLEQAKDVVKKFEDKFHVLTTDMIFLENIQKMLTNLQVKIKGLVVNSNLQIQQINSYLDQLEKKTDACAHPNLDKEAVTSEALYMFAKTVMDEMKKRSLYLSCLLEPRSVISETLLQGPIAAAARVETPLRQESRLTLGTPDSLLNPSRIGKHIQDDVAVGVIKNIMKSQKTGDSLLDPDDGSKHQPVTGVSRPNVPIAPHPPSPPVSGRSSKRKGTKRDLDTSTPKFVTLSVRKLAKPTRFDKKYQVFGEKKEESDNFKGMVTALLWDSNEALLYMAEEFYKRKDRRSIGRHDLLQDTFEECADVMVQKLQTYEKQALEYHNNCLLEFREQLEQFEKLVSHVPPLVIENLRGQHWESLQSATYQIRQAFTVELNKWELIKEEKKSLLRPSLGHPEFRQVLEDVCKQEELRQKEEIKEIEHNAQSLQDCVSTFLKSFIKSLASLTEKILLEMDEITTVDDVTQGRTEKPKEKLSVLIRRKQAGLPLENTDYQPLIERGSRVWSGIIHLKSTEASHRDSTSCLATASVTTAKITLSHISAVEARDSAYKKFLQDTETEINNIREERKQQLLASQRWGDWWQKSICKIKELYV